MRSLREVGVRRIRWVEALWCLEERGDDERDKEAIEILSGRRLKK